MKNSTEIFNRQVTAFMKAIPEEAIVPFQKYVALSVLTKLVAKTPVDTGRARGAWQLSIDVVSENPTTPDSWTSKAPADARIARTASTAVIGALASLEKMPPYCLFIISNSVPYIVALEDGHSKQAPAGMLALTFDEIEQWLSNQAGKGQVTEVHVGTP